MMKMVSHCLIGIAVIGRLVFIMAAVEQMFPLLHERPDLFEAMSNNACMRLGSFAYDARNMKYPGIQVPLRKEDLEYMATQEHYRGCASCFLCYYHLHHSNDVSAYQYSIQSLSFSQLSPQALGCLAALYLRNEAFIRASFFTAAARYISANFTGIMYHDREKHGLMYENISLFEYVDTFHKEHMYPNLRGMGLEQDAFRNYPEGTALSEIVKSSDGSQTLFALYLRYNGLFSKPFVWPSVHGLEGFLELFEHILAKSLNVNHLKSLGLWTKHAYILMGNDFDVTVDEALFPWPKDKTVNVHILPSIPSHCETFSDNYLGMGNMLEQLGVPYRCWSIHFFPV